MKRDFLLKVFIASFFFQTVFIECAFAQIQDKRAFGNKSAGEKRIALVLGNSDYDTSIGKLKNPVNDANDMAEALKRLGFSLVGGKPQFNLNRRQMLEQIREFGSQIKQGGVGLFYFAGHGVQVDRRNYLIPITDSLKYQEDAEFEAVDVDAVLREMEYAENSLNILILDACRNNALPKKTRNLKDGLTEPNRKPSGVYIAFAARDGQTASENASGRNGLYTQELLKNLETPNLRLEDIFIRTRVKVKELSKRTQEPIEYGSLDSTFYFKLNENVAIQPQPSSAQTAWNNFRGMAKNLLKYDEIMPFSDGLAAVKQINKFGFIDAMGKEVISVKFDVFSISNADEIGYEFVETSSFSEGIAPVKQNGKWFLIDKMGKTAVSLKPNYEHVYSFENGFAQVIVCKKEDVYGDGNKLEQCRYGYINKTGREIIPAKYEEVSNLPDGRFIARADCVLFFIDKAGKVTNEFAHDGADFYNGDYFKVFIDNKQSYIDKTGKIVMSEETINKIRAKYGLEVGSFHSGFAVFLSNGKFGFVDMNGNEVVAPKYDVQSSGIYQRFKEGIAIVTINDREGIIDATGKEIVIPQYDYTAGISAYSILNGLVIMRLKGKWGLFDKTGKEITSPKYDMIDIKRKDFFEVEVEKKFGIIDKSGQELVKPIYDAIWYTSNKEFFGVTKNGKKGFVDIYGNEYFDF